MTRAPLVLASLLVVAFAFSGCTGKASGAAAADGPGSVVQAAEDAAAGGGTINGLVVDDSVQPIEGVLVELATLKVQASTDAGGKFTFTHVPAGSHKLFAGKIGYDAGYKSLELGEGETKDVTLTISPIAINDVRVELKIFKGFMPCGFGLVAVTVTASCPLGDYKVYYDSEVVSDVLTVISELAWKQSSTASAQQLRIVMGKDETCNPCSFKYPYGSATGPSPVTLRKDAELNGITGEGEPGDTFKVRHRVWVPGSQPPGIPIVVLQQAFEIYTGHYYGEEAAEGASNLPDA